MFLSPPTLFTRIKHSFARALRETGQALDRVGIRGQNHATSNHNSTHRFKDPTYKFQDHLSRHRTLMPVFSNGAPHIQDEVFIAPCSSVIGKVYIGKGSSVWYGAVVRADKCPMSAVEDDVDVETATQTQKKGYVSIGTNSMIQDGCIITADKHHPTIIGNNVIIGVNTSVNSANIDDYCVIGMGSIVGTNCQMEALSVVESGSVLEKGCVVKSGEVWRGNPGKKIRELSEDEVKGMLCQGQENDKLGKRHIPVMKLGGNVSDQQVQTHLLLHTRKEGTSDSLEQHKGT